MEIATLRILLGDKIRKYRRLLGLTQLQLGKKIGINQRHIAYIENGHCFPSFNTLIKLAEIFDCELKKFFEFDTNSTNKNMKRKIYRKILEMDNGKLDFYDKIFDVLNGS